jgi:amidase
MTDDIEATLLSGSIAEIGAAYDETRLSVAEAVDWYLRRIEAHRDLNAVREVSRQAREDGARADREIAEGGRRGPLHGIPILLKDNIATADGMTMAAGAAALGGYRPVREATLVRRLRAAGAVILGKTNMTEFADYVSDVMPSEFSGHGGVVKNPHGPAWGRGQGSSVGSASAVAAALAPAAIGSETQNSLQTPACRASVAAVKPSVGLVSRAGMVPLVPSQDSPGPVTRSTADAALILAVLAGPDPRDTASLGLPTLRPRTGGVAGLRLGVPRRAIADRPEYAAAAAPFAAVLSRLAAAGAVIVDPCDLPSAEQLQEVRSSVFRTEFKVALDAFLEDCGAPCGIGSMAALIAWNERHPDKIPYGQSLLLAAEATAGLDGPQYRADRARDLALSRAAGIDAVCAMADLDALIVPMDAAAKCTGKAGAPVVAIPCGTDEAGLPFGITLLASWGADSRLLTAAAAAEAVIGARVLPSAC